MTTTKNYARGRVWQDTDRTALTVRVPVKLHKRLTKLALKKKVTINDLMLAVLEVITNPKR